MNFSSVIPQPNIIINRPMKVSPKGNLFKIPISHMSADGKSMNNIEIWATKEAVQKHLNGTTGEPHSYELIKFARQTYEKQLRSNNGQLPHKGILVTTDSVTHGDPRLWPSTISHPEIKT